MAEDLIPQFEHQALEGDIQVLAKEVAEHKAHPETKHLEGHPLIKKSIQTATEKFNGPMVQSSALQNPMPDYVSEAAPEVKLAVEQLLDMAVHHGIMKADREARKTNPFILDAFHDALSKKLYPVLQSKGVVE